MKRSRKVRKTSRRKAMIGYVGKGRYEVVGKTRTSVVKRAHQATEIPGMVASFPAIKKFKYKSYR